MTKRIIIFDDNPQRRDSLNMLLSMTPGMACVGSFEDCRDVLFKVEQSTPDIVLMDIDMPHVNGIEGVRIIRTRYPNLKIIMQTVFDDEDKVLNAICAGADGYILKQTSPSKLIEAIEDVSEGGAPMSGSIARKVLMLFKKQETIAPKLNIDLTKRELEVLELLVKGLSYKMIAEACHISYATVNTHISNIYAKLQVDSVGGAVSKAIKEGLI